MAKKINVANRTIFWRDNIEVLPGINSESVDLIYLDPPFGKRDTWQTSNVNQINRIRDYFIFEQTRPKNKNDYRLMGKDFNKIFSNVSYGDTWKPSDVVEGQRTELSNFNNQLTNYLSSIQNSVAPGGFYYLIFMSIRLIEMHRILKDTGSIYLHCDSLMSHYLKVVMDKIFGEQNFRSEIVWQRNDGRAKGSQYQSSKYGQNTDIILFYSKTDKVKLRATRPLTDKEIVDKFDKIDRGNNINQLDEVAKKSTKKTDRKGERYYTGIPLFCSRSMGARPNLCYEWRGFKNPHPSGWRLSKERLEEEYQKGNVVITDDGKLERRKYLKDYEGFPLDNNWTDIPRIVSGTGYPTEKPLPLLERIIQASSNKGDMVLDPFCGCATACVAAEKLGRQWIGIDLNEQAFYMNWYRLKERTDQGEMDLVSFKHLVKELVLWSEDKKPPRRTDTPESEHKQQVKKRIEIQERIQADKLKSDREYKKNYDYFKEVLYEQQAGRCAACDIFMPLPDLTIDHVIPQSKRGDHGIDNLQLLCWRDNHYRGDKSMEYLLKKLLDLSLISKSTHDKQIKLWQEFRKNHDRITKRYSELYPKQI